MSQKQKQIIKPDEVIMLGKNIREVRMQNKMTQEDVTTKLQLKGLPISRVTYAKIEAGIRNIEASYLEAIKDVLNTTYERIFEHTN